MRKALGIAVNGQNIKIAELTRTKDNLFISMLDDGMLADELENPVHDQTKDEVDNILNDSGEEANFGSFSSETPAYVSDDTSENFEILHSLFQRFASRKIQTAFNAPTDKVIYQEIEGQVVRPDESKKSILSSLSFSQKSAEKKIYNIVPQGDGPAYNVYIDGEDSPVLQTSLEQLNSLFKGNLMLAAMVPNELALVNLVNRNYNFDDPDAVSAIIYIEGSVSRIIFLRGSFFWFLSPLYVEGDDENINALIYSKILYELDNHNVEHLSNIFLACGAVNDATYMYFLENFPNTTVDLIISHLFAEKYSFDYDRPRLAEYAIPIALALETISSRDVIGIKGNLLPAEVINRHKILKLSKVGYVLLGMLAAATLTFTYLIADNAKAARHLIAQNTMLQEQIIYNQDLVEQVEKLSADIVNLETSLTLSDSLGAGYDNLNLFLDVLNQSIRDDKSLWITHMENNKEGFNITGASLKRENIPVLSSKVGYNLLKKVYREEIDDRKVYNFEMDVRWPNLVTARLQEEKRHREEEMKTRLAAAPDRKVGDLPAVQNQAKKTSQPAAKQAVAIAPSSPSPKLTVARDIRQPQIESAVQSEYTVYAGGFFSSVGAEKLVNSLAARGIEADIYQIDGKGYNYSVCIGRFSDSASATQERARLEEETGLHFTVVAAPRLSRQVQSRFLTSNDADSPEPKKDLRSELIFTKSGDKEIVLPPINIPRPDENGRDKRKEPEKKKDKQLPIEETEERSSTGAAFVFAQNYMQNGRR